MAQDAAYVIQNFWGVVARGLPFEHGLGGMRVAAVTKPGADRSP
jgi:hypothetical protein